jgi:hypothetical protein
MKKHLILLTILAGALASIIFYRWSRIHNEISHRLEKQPWIHERADEMIIIVHQCLDTNAQALLLPEEKDEVSKLLTTLEKKTAKFGNDDIDKIRDSCTSYIESMKTAKSDREKRIYVLELINKCKVISNRAHS